jgi:hypothetical protein
MTGPAPYRLARERAYRRSPAGALVGSAVQYETDAAPAPIAVGAFPTDGQPPVDRSLTPSS